MLYVKPAKWWSEVYEIVDDSRRLTEVNIRWSREAGSFTLDGDTFDVGREGWMSGDYFLERGGTRIARADKPSAWHRRFTVHVQGTKFELTATSAFSRKFVLKKGGRAIGTVEPESCWNRRAIVDLPDELPVEVRVFLVWLVLVMWKRQRQASSSGAS